MLSSPQTKLPLFCVYLALMIATGCSRNASDDSPTAPSQPTGTVGAVIAGTVMSGQASVGGARALGSSDSLPSAGSTLAGLTVQVVGSSLSAIVSAAGAFEISGVPAGNVRLQFRGDSVNATTDVGAVSAGEFVQLQVQVSGTSATIVNDSRSQKIAICHAEGTGDYHLIDISTSAEAAHRAHGDAQIGEPVPGRPGKMFDSGCRPVGPAVDIKKYTNDADADAAPGPEIMVGSSVTWKYVVKNSGTIDLSGISVVDNRGVVVNCNGQTTLGAGATLTCFGTGVATAGQYSNIGTVTAHWATGALSGTVTGADSSHYLGVTSEAVGPKVTLCHKTGAGFYVQITVSVDAEPAHRAHGDGKPGETVPGVSGKFFTASCGVQ